MIRPSSLAALAGPSPSTTPKVEMRLIIEKYSTNDNPFQDSVSNLMVLA